MKIIDNFFSWILAIQFVLEKMEEWYLKKRQYLSWILFSTFAVGIIFILCKQVIIGEIIFLSGMLFVGFDNIVGWKHSVRRWLKICIIYNLFFSLILACVVQGAIQYTIITPVFIAAYLIVWIFLSLISNSKVSLLVNEIVSGIAATVFTIGTYLISMALKNMPSSNDYLNYFQTDEVFENALANGDALAWSFLGIGILEMLEGAFLSLLPIIGVTALCIIMIKIKGYWMEKNKIFEPETEIGQKDEQEMSAF